MNYAVHLVRASKWLDWYGIGLAYCALFGIGAVCRGEFYVHDGWVCVKRGVR